MHPTPLHRASDWQAGPDGGQLDPSWAQGRAGFGGLLVTGALRAAAHQVAPDRPLRSALVDFVGPVQPGAVGVHVEVLRAGGSLTRVEVRLSQGDAVRAVVLASFGAPRPTQMAQAGPRAPEMAAPDGLASLPFVPGITPTFTQHFEYRWTVDSLPFTGSDRGHVQGWIRPRDTAPVDLLTLPALLDAWPPPVWSRASRPFPGSSVTWQINLLGGAPAGGWARDAWWRYDAETIMAADGYTDFAAHLWDADGQLIATSRQLFAEFSGGR